MANGNIRAAVSGEADELSRIALEAKAHWGYPRHLLDLWANDLAADPESCDGESVWVIECDEELVGFGEILVHADTAVLDDLWIDPKHMGRGYGGQLFRLLQATAAKRGAKRMTIEADPNATGFYEHMGARMIGEIESTSVPGRRLPFMELALQSGENTTITPER